MRRRRSLTITARTPYREFCSSLQPHRLLYSLSGFDIGPQLICQEHSEANMHDSYDDIELNPTSFFIGDDIDWKSERKPIELVVELPFWLLIPPGNINITVGPCTLHAVVCSGVEFQLGTTLTRSHINTLFIGPSLVAEQNNIPISILSDGAVKRFTRTIVAFRSHAHSDAIAAISGDFRRRNQGYEYFATLAFGHLSFLNQLINSYRRVVVDPFVTEVSEWDVPVWFLATGQGLVSIPLSRYSVQDDFPSTKGMRDSHGRPYYAAKMTDIEAASKLPVVPGEIELLDGWSLYFRGKYGDSIRSLVTAVEVLLESQLRAQLLAFHKSPEIVYRELELTRNNFWDRVDHYCELAGVRVPGPLLHYIPYINGVRLREEMEHTRRLRHNIVHHGKRLDHNLRPVLQRAAETTTWFFDWLSENGDFAGRQSRHYSFFSSQRNHCRFPFEIRSEGVVVLALHSTELSLSDDEGEDNEVDVIESADVSLLPVATLVATLKHINGRGPDLELFTLMALTMLRLDAIGGGPPPPRGLDGEYDRFRIFHAGQLSLVFLAESHVAVNESTFQKIGETIQKRVDEGLQVSSVLIVVNEYSSLPWSSRPFCSTPLNDTMARHPRLSVVRTDDLLRLVIGYRKYGWSNADVYESMMLRGRNRCPPPDSVEIGLVGHFYAKPRVASICLYDTIEISVGDMLCFRLPDGFHQARIESLEQNRQRVATVTGGTIGVKVALERNQLPLNSKVFVKRRN